MGGEASDDLVSQFEVILNQLHADFDCDLILTCMACPVGIEGTIGAAAVDFRARGDY